MTDVVYGRKFGLALTLDIAWPAEPSGVVVLGLSSGGWQSWPEAGKPDPKEFLRRGQTFVTVMHGSRPKFGVPEMVADIRRAIRFVRQHAGEYGVDDERLGLFGISSGGNLSLLTAAQGGDGDRGAADPVDRLSDRAQAVACFYPPTDLANFGAAGKVWLPFPQPGVDGDAAAVARACSPVTYFTKAMPPTLIVHGDADELVPWQQAQQAVGRLRELGVEHHLETRPGKGHGWPDMDAEHARCAAWFDDHLRSRN
jgi:acetyl esterase/lipase